MRRRDEIFSQLVEQILQRFCAQNGRDAPAPPVLAGFAARLWALVRTRGLPRPLAKGETGTPGELGDDVCASLLAGLWEDTSSADQDFFAVPLRQLIKACFHPEFKVCRDSFRERASDGSCRRQQLPRVRLRVSGTHCIDCPYWVGLRPEQHISFLEREWLADGRPDLAEHRAIFLPEDFRRLRQFLHHAARHQDIGL